MHSKQDILNAILQTAKENGGKPLGTGKFKKQTGISPHDWGKFWPRFGDAQREAGYEPNQLNTAFPAEFILDKAIGLIRKLGKFPTNGEYRVERIKDPQFPNEKAFRRFGSKQKFAQTIIEYCNASSSNDDVVEICKSILEKSDQKNDMDIIDDPVGEVYLFKSGRYYKIGKTKDSVRRGNELRIQLPEQLDLIHSIKTDDPNGIEAYWHHRFEPKRMKGEWFNLTSTDIKAFKRWRRIT